jgi:hypothetical protein
MLERSSRCRYYYRQSYFGRGNNLEGVLSTYPIPKISSAMRTFLKEEDLRLGRINNVIEVI